MFTSATLSNHFYSIQNEIEVQCNEPQSTAHLQLPNKWKISFPALCKSAYESKLRLKPADMLVSAQTACIYYGSFNVHEYEIHASTWSHTDLHFSFQRTEKSFALPSKRKWANSGMLKILLIRKVAREQKIKINVPLTFWDFGLFSWWKRNKNVHYEPSDDCV